MIYLIYYIICIVNIFYIAIILCIYYMYTMSTDKPKVILVLDHDIIQRIDDYRYGNRIPSRSEAIRRLILETLQKYENPPQEKP